MFERRELRMLLNKFRDGSRGVGNGKGTKLQMVGESLRSIKFFTVLAATNRHLICLFTIKKSYEVFTIAIKNLKA